MGGDEEEAKLISSLSDGTTKDDLQSLSPALNLPDGSSPFNEHSHNHSHEHPHSHSHEESHAVPKHKAHLQPGYNPSITEIRSFYNISPDMDFEEASYLIRTILSFKYYQRYAFAMNHVRMQNFYALPEAHRALLKPRFTEKLQAIDEAIEKNALIAKRIARLGEQMYLGGMEVKTGGPLSPKQKDMEKAKSTLKQFVRDWSEEGSEERQLCYGPILTALNTLFGSLSMEEKAEIRVLVPGAGLGRIVYEILRAGYEVQGNELEFCMLMASNLALNELNTENPYELYPYIHTMSHHRTTQDLLRCVRIPDDYPAHGIRLSETKGQMSMVAGDFTECYASPDDAATFSVVVTTFFIDTAANVLNYLETIHHVLEPNGVWINLGPLAWHFEPDDDATRSGPSRSGGSIELTLDELMSVVKEVGFVLEKGHGLDPRSIKMPYMANSRAMLTYLYETEFWVARKV